jgi:hypothetical protein
MATIRQQNAIRGVLIDKKSVQRAMLDAGFSPNVAKNAKVLTQSKAFIETVEKLGLSDENIVKRHNELMRSKKEEIAIKAVDLAYKVKGKYDTHVQRNQFNAPVLIQITPPQVPVSDVTIHNMATDKDI